MNPALKNIFARRSVRKFKSKEVPEAMIKDILEAAMAAPSAVGKDPWHFVVVREAAARARLTEGLPNGVMLNEAPVGIVVGGDTVKVHDGLESYLLQDCSAAIENLLLAASTLGLGACWLGVHPRPERIDHVRRVVDLPKHVLPVAVVAVGWPVEEAKPRTRFNSVAVHWERW